jgi:uncharacterized protein YeaO (DUF488 family)
MAAPVSTYRYGSARRAKDGLRIGTARFVPRGVPREDWQRKGYFDLWVPLLSPDPEFIKQFLHGKMTFATFARHYRARIKQKESWQVVELLAGISLFLPISLGCYCEDESRCHRSILKKFVDEEAKKRRPGFEKLRSAKDSVDLLRYASPVCFADFEQ